MQLTCLILHHGGCSPSLALCRPRLRQGVCSRMSALLHSAGTLRNMLGHSRLGLTSQYLSHTFTPSGTSRMLQHQQQHAATASQSPHALPCTAETMRMPPAAVCCPAPPTAQPPPPLSAAPSSSRSTAVGLSRAATAPRHPPPAGDLQAHFVVHDCCLKLLLAQSVAVTAAQPLPMTRRVLCCIAYERC